MSGAPQLGGDLIPQHSDLKVPTLSSGNAGSSAPPAPASQPAASNGSTIQNAKDTVVNSEAYNAVANHPVAQNLAETVNNGLVAKEQAQKTSTSFSNLAASRQTPSTTAATGQQLTHYHSFFYTTLSWQEPHATAVSYGAIIFFIFAARYLHILPLIFKAICWVLGTTALAESAGRLVFKQGLASAFRPRRYYTLPRESLEAATEDLEQLINFFVIEAQRIVFAENVSHTLAAFAAFFTAFLLIKLVPFWGLSVIAVTIAYFTPLIYITNREVIDDLLNTVSEILNQQANQVKGIASQHSSSAATTIKSYTSEYTAKAQEYIGSAKPKPHTLPPSYTEKDFPKAPKQELSSGPDAAHQTILAS